VLRAVGDVGWLQLATSQHLQLHVTQTKTASVVPAEDGRLTPEACRFKTQSDCESESVLICYVIVIHNDTRSTKHQMYTFVYFTCSACSAHLVLLDMIFMKIHGQTRKLQMSLV
jgi:hypothetical protein